jgi:hypothetical protein
MEERKKLSKDRLLSQREKKLDKLKTLKADAENLKQSLTAFKTESKKHDTKHEVHNEEKLYELVVASGISVDRDVVEHIVELLKLNVNPDKLFDVFQALTKLKRDLEMVTVI